MPVDVAPDPFKNHAHGTQVKDQLAPAAAAATPVFVGYPDCITVEAAAGSVISATGDMEIVSGAPAVKAGATWVELGTVGATGFLRLKRVRYPFLQTADLGGIVAIHTGELNVVESGGPVAGLDG